MAAQQWHRCSTWECLTASRAEMSSNTGEAAGSVKVGCLAVVMPPHAQTRNVFVIPMRPDVHDDCVERQMFKLKLQDDRVHAHSAGRVQLKRRFATGCQSG